MKNHLSIYINNIFDSKSELQSLPIEAQRFELYQLVELQMCFFRIEESIIKS